MLARRFSYTLILIVPSKAIPLWPVRLDCALADVAFLRGENSISAGNKFDEHV